MKKTCLVLEGGAMRGIYTSAIIDTFLDENIHFDCLIGVSAGALFGVNYVSKQKERSLRYNKKYINNPNYMGLWSLIKTGSIVNKDFAYNKIPNELDKFDEKEFKKSKTKFYATITNIETGLPEYIHIKDTSKQIDAFRASGSMPFVSEIVDYEGNKYLDGALGDSIPVLKAKEMGYDKIVVVLTQPEDFRKKKNPAWIAKLMYHKYPKLIEAINTRYLKYNETLDIIKDLEKKKEIFVIRPSSPLNIKRIEKDLTKIDNVYDLGLKDAKKSLKKLKKYMEQ
jgi:predicted patatin/cPLA2 family phospholipase